MRWGLSLCTPILLWNLPSWRKSWDSEYIHTPSLLKLKINPLVKSPSSSPIWESTKVTRGAFRLSANAVRKIYPVIENLQFIFGEKKTVNTSGYSCLRRIILSDDKWGRILPNGNQWSKLRLYKSGVSTKGQHNRDQCLALPTHKPPMKGSKSSEQTEDQVEHNFPR